MKRIFFLSLAALYISALSAQTNRNPDNQNSATTNVMTFNIRYSTKNDGINQWDNRREKAIETILTNDADILGVQEALHSQMIDLKKGLKDYESTGVGRDDGMEKGEYSPIFYHTKRFTKVKSGYFWLSQRPRKAGSMGWDAANTRIATWAKLKDLRSGTVIFVLNTHFDHVGKVARRESVRLILEKVRKFTKRNQYPVIVTGDFNATPDSEVIKNITDTKNPLHLTDSHSVSPTTSGPSWSFHDFGRLPADERPLLDYIFVKNKISVLDYKIIEGNAGNYWISDHCPVLVTVRY